MTSISPIRFSGQTEVKRQLVLAAQAARDVAEADGEPDRFSLGMLHGTVASAMMDPAFRDVLANPEALVDEEIEIPKLGKSTLAENLESQGALLILYQVLMENLTTEGPAGDKLEISIPLKKRDAMRNAFMQDQATVIHRLFKTIVENVHRLDGPRGDMIAMIDAFREGLENKLNDQGLGDLPIFKKQADGDDWDQAAEETPSAEQG